MIVKRSITKEEISQLPMEGFRGKIVVVQDEAETEKAVRFLNDQLVVGIDTETRPSFKKGLSHVVALLQVSTEDVCFLFRLNMLGMPDALIRFLENPAVKKIGLSLKDDFMALRRRTAFTPQACIELQDFVKPFGIQDKSLQKIYAILFTKRISKSKRLSNWEADVLSDAQKLYAATDAWACYNIYSLLQRLQRTGNYEKEKIIETADKELV